MKTLKIVSKLSAVLLLMCTFFFSANAFAQDAKVIKIEGHDSMKFSKEKITATPGQEITIELTTVSKFPEAAMAHNFVLLKRSTDAKAFAMASAKFRDNEFIDPDKEDEVIAHTAMASGGETVTVTFIAPKEPGQYTYVCTFPGHFVAGMKGTFTVK